MQENPLIETLNERIKELTCLYEISNIGANLSLALDDQLQSIVQILPDAWKYPEHGIAELNLDSKFFFSDKLPEEYVSLKNLITVDNQDRGYLAIHYDSKKYGHADFLPEEKILLKTLAQEVAGIIDRYEQKQREEKMRKKFQHNDRLAILGEITAGIAHELNTPLGNILGFSQLIQERNKDYQINHDIEKIIHSVMHSREIVKKLMFFSCEMPQQMQKVSIIDLINDALEFLRFTIKSAHVDVIFNKNADELVAQVDTVQFTQVIFNLLINAIHASLPGQKILIKLKSDKTKFTLTVTDHGHGIPEEIKDKVFEPFFTTKKTGEGSGLGLSVVHGIVKNHKGEISFQSEEKKETTFEVVFPLTQDHE